SRHPRLTLWAGREEGESMSPSDRLLAIGTVTTVCVVSLVVAAFADSPTFFPMLSATANAPITVQSGQTFSYQIRANDIDTTYGSGGSATSAGDELDILEPNVHSMQSYTITGGPILDGSGQFTGEAVWTVTGTAVSVGSETDFHDEFGVTDFPVGDGSTFDGEIRVNQVVIVAPATP